MDMVKVEPDSNDEDPLSSRNSQSVMVKDEKQEENQRTKFSLVAVKCEKVSQVSKTFHP
jgi:hypothetical protein